MDLRIFKCLMLAVGCGVVGGAVAAEDAVQRSIESTTDAYSVGRQSQDRTAEAFVDKGNELFVNGSYKDAALNYAQAAYIFDSLKDNSPHFQDRLLKTREQIAKSYYYLARETAQRAHEQANASELDTAIALCREAIEIYPPCEAEMKEQIATYEKMRSAAVKRARLSEDQVMPDHADRKYRIAVLLKQAKILYYTRQFEKARHRYKEVLLLDKLNPEAIQGLRAANVQLQKTADARYSAAHKYAMAEAAWESVLPVIAKKTGDARTVDGKQAAAAAGVDDGRELREKLQNIVLPRVNFSGDDKNPGTPLPLAVKFLRERSRQFDPTGEGVNILLHYPLEANDKDGQGARPAPAARNDAGLLEGGVSGKNRTAGGSGDEEGDEEESEPAEDYSGYPTVTLDMVQKPLIDVIDALAQAANMKYKIEKHAVLLAPKDVPLSDMQIKVFRCDAAMIGALGGGSGVQEQLDAYGVSFPAGAKVMYDERFNSLIVLNTPENLEKIGNVLLDLRKQDAPPLIQIQVKFVEVQQNDLKELGFIQTLGRPNGSAEGKTRGRLQFDANDEVLYNSGANTFTYSRSTDGYNYNMVANMVDKLDSKDVLSAPKVLTDPGEEVKIEMVTERYFKWDYEEVDGVTQSYDDNSGDTLVVDGVLWPEFEMIPLGITLSVTPNVDVDKRLIFMTLRPNVKTLAGWTTYSYTPEDEGSTEQTISRPIIAERRANTTVAVADNETIVLGGIIKDYTITINDKVPFLGDIPIIGHLFQSKANTVTKTNLLVFVTARLLKADGSPYFQFDAHGRPSAAGAGELY